MGKRLYKSAEDRAISGVCGGIAEYFDIDSVIVRLIFVIAAFAGVGVVAYIAAAIIIPQQPYGYYAQGATQAHGGAYESMGQPVDEAANGQGPQGHNGNAHRDRSSGNALLGAILILAGAYLILRRFFYFLDMSFFMAGLLVLLGIVLIVKRK